MTGLNPNFGFTREGINQRLLTGPETFRQYFDFLQKVYLGLQQGPMISDAFQVMNPDEILAAASGWALTAKARNVSAANDLEKFYSTVVSRGFASYGRILNTIRAQANERDVAPFTRSRGDLTQRVHEIFQARPRVREILSPAHVVAALQAGLYEQHFNSDAQSTGISNRVKYARGIMSILKTKYRAFASKYPAEFYLGEARIALARDDKDELDNLLHDRLAIVLEKAADDDPRVQEYYKAHDSVCAQGIRQTPPY